MTTLKKYIDSFFWYDLSNEELIRTVPKEQCKLDYPSIYQTFFGLSPVNFLRIQNKFLTIHKFKKFEEYVLSQGFDIYERGIQSFKYIHHSKRILFVGEITENTNEEEDEDTDEDDTNEPAGLMGTSSDDDTCFISILPTVENKKFIEQFIKKVETFFENNSIEKHKFYMIAQSTQGLFTQKTRFKSIPIKDNRYDLFYGEKFPYEKIKRFINEDTENLMLLHGDPGTGKSNLIKHVITNSKRKVIYIAPSMLSVISSPQFVTFMMNNRNSILLIEDAEEVLSIERNSATNNLLGLTDGFLKDSLGLKVIATFNCDIGRIDPALMRKGRMFLEYKFSELTENECRKLAEFLNINREINSPMTLAEFFNIEDNHVENSFEERKIGFF